VIVCLVNNTNGKNVSCMCMYQHLYLDALRVRYLYQYIRHLAPFISICIYAVASICLEHRGSKFLSPSPPHFSPLSFPSLSFSPALPPLPFLPPHPSPSPLLFHSYRPPLPSPWSGRSGGSPAENLEFYIAVGEF
jgi:hypothetical protein